MDALGESLLKTLGCGLLNDLGDLGGAGCVRLALGATGVVDGVWELVLETLGGLFLDLARDWEGLDWILVLKVKSGGG